MGTTSAKIVKETTANLSTAPTTSPLINAKKKEELSLLGQLTTLLLGDGLATEEKTDLDFNFPIKDKKSLKVFDFFYFRVEKEFHPQPVYERLSRDEMNRRHRRETYHELKRNIAHLWDVSGEMLETVFDLEFDDEDSYEEAYKFYLKEYEEELTKMAIRKNFKWTMPTSYYFPAMFGPLKSYSRTVLNDVQVFLRERMSWMFDPIIVHRVALIPPEITYLKDDVEKLLKDG